MRVVDAVAAWFEEAGIQRYFGYAGGAIWPLLDALVDKPDIEPIQAKIEPNAVHMADVHWRVTGEVAPVVVTKGPGLLNCVCGVATAMHDQAALLVIAGGTTTHFMGKGGMQEIYYKGFEDAVSIFRPITKGAWTVIRPDTVIDTLNQAYKLATSGRPGPVFVQLPLDIQTSRVSGEIEGPAHRTTASRVRADRDTIKKAADLLAAAERPLFLAGGGLMHAGGADALRDAADRLSIPTATTLTAKGLLPEDHPMSLGPVGRSGTQAAAEATRAADLIFALGSRFSDNHTSNWRKGMIYDPEGTKFVQVDLDLGEISRNYPVEVAAEADARDFLVDLLEAASPRERSGWIDQIEAWKKDWRQEVEEQIGVDTSPVTPARLVHEVGLAIRDKGRVLVDIGDIIQYAEPYMEVVRPGAWHITPGMAEMGWASSGVLGAVAAERDVPAIALTGDGAFNMVSNSLATAVEYDLPAIWVIVNNCELGIERKGAMRAFDRIHPWYEFRRRDTGELYNPDYTLLAQANGAEGERVEDPADVAPALQRALASGRPYVLDVVVDPKPASYFTKGLDRAYPNDWASSYAAFGALQNER
ncbi:MAG TPA: thiamine pyrophosphate-binding protein [Solirubrobacterales bacterium]|nr:thiamine pyrophosphate-binding protein [Solirubrobacterales bacterium]